MKMREIAGVNFLYRTIFVNSKRINEYGSLSSYLLLDRKTF